MSLLRNYLGLCAVEPDSPEQTAICVSHITFHHVVKRHLSPLQLVYPKKQHFFPRGKFGEVKKCRERRTGRQLAAKFIEVSGPQDRTDIMNEVEIMKHLQHPRLLQLYDAFEHRDRFCLVLEL